MSDNKETIGVKVQVEGADDLKKVRANLADTQAELAKLANSSKANFGKTSKLASNLADEMKALGAATEKTLLPTESLFKKWASNGRAGRITNEVVADLNKRLGEHFKLLKSGANISRKTFGIMAADVRRATAMQYGLGKAVEHRSKLELRANELSIRAKEAENRITLAGMKIEADREKQRGVQSRADARRYDSTESQARRAVNEEKKRQKDMERQRLRARRDAERNRNYSARHGEGFANSYSNTRRYMNRQTGLLAYRSSLEERRGMEGLGAMRSQIAASLLRYRAEMRAIKINERLTGIVDEAAQDRALKRFQTEQKNARANYGVRMSLARAEQQQLDRADRGRIKLERELQRERRESVRQITGGFDRASRGGHQMARGAAGLGHAALAHGATAAAAIGGGIVARMQTDTAETNLRMFGGEGTTLMSQDQVKKIREGWLDKEALKNGMSVPSALGAYTEVLKAGIDKNQAGEVTKKILEATAGMELNVPETTKLVGRLAQLTQANPEQIGGMLNSMGIVAAETAADSNELVSSLRRGAGALSNRNFKVSDLTAFTGVGISAGIQEGMAGTFIEHQQRDLLNAKYARGQEAKDLNKAFGMLGMGSRGTVSARTAKDPAAVLEELYTKLHDISEKDPVKANYIASLIGKDEWGGKMLMMAQSSGKIRSTRQKANDPNNKDFLTTLKDEKLGSWAGMWNTTKAVFQLFWEKFGLGFDGILRDVTKYFMDLGQNFDWNKVTTHVQAFLDGMKEGFGVRTWRELIDNITGSIGTGDLMTKLKDIGRGIAQGITGFIETVKSMASLVGFDANASAQDMSKLVTQVLLLGAALVVLSPVISVLGLLVGGINLLAGALGAVTGVVGWLLKLGTGTAAGGALSAGAATAGGAAAGAGAGAAIAAGAAGVAAVGGVAAITYYVAKYFTDNLPDFKKPLAEGLREDQSKGWMGKTWNWMLGRDSAPARVQRQSFQSPNGIGTLVQPSSWNGSSDLPDTRLGNLIHRTSLAANNNETRGLGPLTPTGDHRPPGHRNLRATPAREHEEPTLRSMIQTAALSNMSDRMGGLVQFASLGGGLGSALGSFSNNAGGSGTGGGGGGSFGGGSGALLSGQTPGEALGNVGMGYRGIIRGGGGGAGDGGGGGGSGPAKFGMAGQSFDQKAPGIMKNLMSDFGLTKAQAAGVVANLGHESAGFTAYQEGKPLGGGRGGAGWAQWTGPRRRAFEAWAARNNLDPRSDAANYGFLKHELTTTHSRALANLRQTGNAQDATRVFERDFEAAGVKHMDRRYAYANRAMGLNPDGAPVNPAAAGNNGVAAAVNASGAAAAVDVAKKFNGMGEDNAGYGTLKKFMGTEIRGAQNAWCADFVNSSLKAVGMKGTGSRVANSFLGWGQGVDAKDVMKGDVLVEHRGKGLNGQGGHVGMATGNTRVNPRTGELEIESIQGNTSNKVKTEWERASKLAVRRSTEVGQAAATAANPAGGITSSGWKPGAGGNAKAIEGASRAPLPSARMNPEEATRNVPLEPSRTDPSMGRQASLGGSGGGGTGGGGAPQIIIQGHNGDPEALANAVQRRLSERMGRRTHEVEHHWG